MIFAKVDVTLAQHHRVLRIPKRLRAACLGVWLAGLLYTRGNELDGFVPSEAIDQIAAKDVLDQLVLVGLFAAHEKDGVHGYLLLKYSERNEVRSQIEHRRNSLQKRVASWRERHGNAVTTESVTRVKRVGAARAHSDSDSDSDSVSGSLGSDPSIPPPPGDQNGTRAGSIVGREPPRLPESMTRQDLDEERNRQLRAAADFDAEDQKRRAAQ